MRILAIDGILLGQALKSTLTSESFLMLVTSLTPVVGYDRASKIAHCAMGHDLSLREPALQLGFVDEQTFDRVVDPAKMVKPYVAQPRT